MPGREGREGPGCRGDRGPGEGRAARPDSTRLDRHVQVGTERAVGGGSGVGTIDVGAVDPDGRRRRERAVVRDLDATLLGLQRCHLRGVPQRRPAVVVA